MRTGPEKSSMPSIRAHIERTALRRTGGISDHKYTIDWVKGRPVHILHLFNLKALILAK